MANKYDTFQFKYDADLSFEAMFGRLFEQVEARQKDKAGSVCVDTVLLHLVGALLGVIVGTTELEGNDQLVLKHFDVTVVGTSFNRQGDYMLEATAIYVTTVPDEALIKQCKQNLNAALRPIIVTLSDRVAAAISNAEMHGIYERIEIIPVEQFLAVNIYRRSKFKQADWRAALTQIIDKYNLIIDACETDPSLKITIG